MIPGYVIWHDAHSSDKWDDIPAEFSPCEVFTAGFITEHADGFVVVGNYTKEHSPNGKLCFGVTQIPRGCVKTIRYFEGFEY